MGWDEPSRRTFAPEGSFLSTSDHFSRGSPRDSRPQPRLLRRDRYPRPSGIIEGFPMEDPSMPEDAEVPTEHVQEAVEHELHARHAAGGTGGTAWTSLAALSAAILAVFAALSALYAGHDANEAMLEQIRASDGYAFYQAKGIKSSILQ